MPCDDVDRIVLMDITPYNINDISVASRVAVSKGMRVKAEA
jgi:predicted nucleic acid-binding OB-fold protein